MCRDELVTMVTRRPFRPFRVSVSDGTDFVVYDAKTREDLPNILVRGG